MCKPLKVTSSDMCFTAVLSFLRHRHAAQVLWLKQNLPFVDPRAAAYLRLPLNPQGSEPLVARGGSRLILPLCCCSLWLSQQAGKGPPPASRPAPAQPEVCRSPEQKTHRPTGLEGEAWHLHACCQHSLLPFRLRSQS